MNLELILAVIGAVGGVLWFGLILFVGVTTLWCRLRSGQWWWDEAGDGLESGRG